MIAVGAQTFANPVALRNMRRDCMSDHIFLEGRVQVEWIKGRACQIQRRSFLRNRRLSVPNLIDRALEITQPLARKVSAGEADQLFLVAGILTSRQIRLIPHCEVVEHVKSFALRHNLRDSGGSPLALTIASLRPTGLTLAHSALRNDILKTQMLANHTDPNQTRRYIDRPITRAEQAVTIARLRAALSRPCGPGMGSISTAARRAHRLLTLATLRRQASFAQIPSPVSRQVNAKASFAQHGSVALRAQTRSSRLNQTHWPGSRACVMPLQTPESKYRQIGGSFYTHPNYRS